MLQKDKHEKMDLKNDLVTVTCEHSSCERNKMEVQCKFATVGR